MAVPLAQLKTAIQADANLNTMVTAQDWPGIANYYNTVPGSPAVLWRKDIPVQDFIGAFAWPEVNLFTADVTSRLNVLLRPDVVDATNPNTRAGLQAIFTASQPLTQAALIALGKRNGTRFESLAAFLTLVGGANVSTQYGAALTALDVQQAMGS